MDQALITRYFGSKARLFIAVLRAEEGDGTLPSLADPERVLDLFERVGRLGPGPVFQVAVQPTRIRPCRRPRTKRWRPG